MKIGCIVLGTRGDVQPVVALVDGLLKKGHEVTICAPPENEEMVGSLKCKFIPFGPDIKKASQEKPGKQKGGVAVKISPKEGKKIINDQIEKLPELLKGSDMILGVGIVLGVHTAADILRVPYRFLAFYPIILGTTQDDPLKSRVLFRIGRSFINIFIRGFINRQRKKFLLAPIKDVWTHWLGEEVIVACDPEISKVPKGVAFPYIQTGFLTSVPQGQLPEYVTDFCNSGKPPVFIGFGSNPIKNKEKYIRIFEKVSKTTRQRLIISKGWAGLTESDSDDILYVDDMPFDLLFPLSAAAIHHGGAGTMASIARAGIPQAAFPFMADQFSNRDNIVRLKVGPPTCNFKEITDKSITAAINSCLTENNYKKNAEDLSERLKKSDGVDSTISLIEKLISKLTG